MTLLAGAALLASSPAALAQTTVQAPAALNHNAAYDIGSNNDESVDLATDEKGTWIAVWHAPADDQSIDCTGSITLTCGPDLDIMFAVSQDAGDSWSLTRFLNTDARSDSNTDADPRIATDGKGNWVVVWIRGVGGAVSRSVDDGQTWTAPATIPNLSLLGTTLTDTHELVTDRRGVWNLIWASQAQGTGTDFDIFLSRSTDNGVTWSPTLIEVNEASTDDSLLDQDTEPAIATDGLGNWVAVWDSTNDSASRGVDPDILASTSFDGGLTWGTPVSVNSDATTDSGTLTLAQDLDPSIATDRRGNWVVVWHEFQDAASSTGTDGDILSATSTTVGASWTTEAAIDPNAATDLRGDRQAVIETDLNGNWQIAWEASTVQSPDTDLLLSTSTAVAGTAWSAPVLLNTNATTDSGNDVYPDLKADGQGNWIAVWSSTDDLGSTVFNDPDIFFTTFSAIPQLPTNDLSIRAQDIFENVPVLGTLEAATSDGGSNCAGSTDVWYRFTPTVPDTYFFGTCGSHDIGGTDSGTDTVVSVHSDEPGTGANEIGCNDDWPSGEPPDACLLADAGLPRDSSMAATLDATDPVWIRVANYSGTPQATFNLKVLPEPGAIPLLATGCAGLVAMRLARRGRR